MKRDETTKKKQANFTCSRILCAPCAWFRAMSNELDLNFIVGVIVVYGMSQGIGGSLHRVILEYYWKDVQLAQPSSVQVYHGIISIPWDVKPIWGLLTDIVPIAGYHRRPYFIISGLLGAGGYMALLLGGKMHPAMACSLLVACAVSSAIAEVTLDAVAAKKSRDRPELAADVQSLCYMSLSMGRLAGYSLSGAALSAFGPQGAMGLLSIPPIMFIILGFLLHEPIVPRYRRLNSQVVKNVLEASKKMWNTFKSSAVWKPALYMFLSWALCPDISEGLFFFYTNPFIGLAFSQDFIGLMYAIGSIGAFVGVLTYRNLLRGLSFRCLLFWVQMVIAVFGMLDLILVTHFNLRLGMSNHLFAVLDESFSRGTDRLKYTPLFVLCAKLCPSGIEGTFFALLVSIDNVGLRFSSLGGGILLELLHVTRDHFQNLWMAVLIRNGLRLSPLLLLFLVPDQTPDVNIMPYELLGEQQENVSDQQDLAYHLLMPDAEHISQSR